MKKRFNYLEILVLISLFAWYGLFLVHKIDLMTADLGRHLQNGKLLLEDFSRNSTVLSTNFYSYTQPDYPTINHHWLSGVIFFLVFGLTGLVGLHLFFIGLSFLAFWLFSRVTLKEAGLGLAVILSLLIIPLIAERIEIRPEVFSYVFSGLFLNLLWGWRRGSFGFRWLLFLPLIEVFWVNLHIYFILGPVLIGVFLLESLLISERRRYFLKLSLVFLLVMLSTLINPFGLKGSFDPLTIFQNYGYRLLENQSIWFLEKLGFILNPNFLLFKIVLAVLLLSFLAVARTNWRKILPANLILAVSFILAAALAIRNFTIFGLFSLPVIAANLKISREKFSLPEKISLDFFSIPRHFLSIGLGVLIIVFSLISHQSRLSLDRIGLGVLEGNSGATDFFKTQGISGPIFNNYDIGGYLIFYLFPRERVFVDNRPEAYSADFFQKEYVPMQENEAQWRAEEQKYGFNAIFFAWHDATPWGQQFLTERVKDKTWAPVFVDDFAIIFLKKNGKNQDVIDRYEIPRNYFKTQ